MIIDIVFDIGIINGFGSKHDISSKTIKGYFGEAVNKHNRWWRAVESINTIYIKFVILSFAGNIASQ